MAYLEVDNISKTYGDVKAVKNISMKIEPGIIYGLLGPNGAGKTTTIRMIMNIIIPDTGNIKILGENRTDHSTDRIGYLPEERGLYRKMKVGELIEFFASIKGFTGKEARKKADYWLERFDLASWKDKKAEELSKGMQQKVQFISTILHDPDMVILDEPFSGLDPLNVNLLKDIILELKDQKKAVALSTHMLDSAEKLCEHIFLINKGEKIVDGTIKEIKGEYGRDTVFMEYNGTDNFLNRSDIIRKINKYENMVEIRLQPEADPQQLLNNAMKEAEVYRFEWKEPSLNEIFIDKVGNNKSQ